MSVVSQSSSDCYASSARTATPNPPRTYIRLPDVLMIVPVSKSTLWRRVRANEFPAPIKLGQRISVWAKEDVFAYVRQQEAAQ